MIGSVRIDDGLSLDEVAAALRMPRARVFRVERDALTKMAIGLTLVELLGRARAEVLLAALRGRPVAAWRGVLLEARAIALREANRAR